MSDSDFVSLSSLPPSQLWLKRSMYPPINQADSVGIVYANELDVRYVSRGKRDYIDDDTRTRE